MIVVDVLWWCGSDVGDVVIGYVGLVVNGSLNIVRITGVVFVSGCGTDGNWVWLWL